MLWCARSRAVAVTVFFLLCGFVLESHLSLAASAEPIAAQPHETREFPPFAGWLLAAMVVLMAVGLSGLFRRRRRAKRTRLAAEARDRAGHESTETDR